MRRPVWIVSVAALLGLAGRAVPADLCVAYPPVSDFKAVLGTNINGEPQVQITWKPADPSFLSYPDYAYDMFQRYDIQRRDDTSGGAFVSLSENNPHVHGVASGSVEYASDDYYFNEVERADVFPPCAINFWGPCAKLGRKYTYRVVTKWKYLTICPLYENGKLYESPSAEVQLTMPDAPAPKVVAQNVRAVADPKVPRVNVSWTQPAGTKTDKVEIRRRRLPANPSSKADSDWIVVATLDGGTKTNRKFVDKQVDADGYYQYLVALYVAGQGADSQSDGAFTAGVCPSSLFRIWGRKFVVPESPDAKLEFDQVPTEQGQISGRLSPACDGDCGKETPDVVFEKFTGIGAPKIKTKLRLDSPGGPFAALSRNAKGVAEAYFDLNFGPMDASRWLEGFVRFTIYGKKYVREFGTDPAQEFQTVVCATLAAPPQFRTASARPGQKVAFTFQCVALGPMPLLAKRLHVVATIEGGVIDHHASDYALAVLESSDKKLVEFELPAIGPLTTTKSERATIVVVGKADEATVGGQMRCHFTLVPSTDPIVEGTPTEVITLPVPTRFAEVNVDGKPMPVK